MTDPYLILGVPRDADDDMVQAAYLAGLKRFPPDREPERFKALRAAYESVRTRRDRLAHDLFNSAAPTAEEILDALAPVGPPRRPDLTQLQALLRGEP